MTVTTAPLSPQKTSPLAAPSLLSQQMRRLEEDDKLFELVDGQPLETQMSDLAQLVADNLKDMLVLWAAPDRLGRSFVEATYQCFPHQPGMVRRADVSYISSGRLAGYEWTHSHLSIAPDLAVEVVSPNDNVYDLDRKINDYFRAGVRRVWVINPDLKIVRVHRGPGDIAELVGDVELSDPIVLPGFRCSLSALFARPSAPLMAERDTAAHPST